MSQPVLFTVRSLVLAMVVAYGLVSPQYLVGANRVYQNDDTAYLQELLDNPKVSTISIPYKPKGYVIRSPLVIKRSIRILGNQNFILYTGSEAAIRGVSANGAAQVKPIFRVSLQDLLIEVSKPGAIGFDASNFSYSTFENFTIKLKPSARNGIGLLLQGNNQGSAPYYNVFKDFMIIGGNDGPSKSVGQTGIVLREPTNSKYSAGGANANSFNHIKRIAAVDIAIDLQAGDGNVFSGVNTESIRRFHFRFNHLPPSNERIPAARGKRSAPAKSARLRNALGTIVIADPSGVKNQVRTERVRMNSTGSILLEQGNPFVNRSTASNLKIYPSKAVGNKISFWRAEGHGNSVGVKFCHGARQNTVSDIHIGSLSSVYAVFEDNDFSNQINELKSYTFIARSTAGGAQLQLAPAAGRFGGMPIPRPAIISGVQVSVLPQGATSGSWKPTATCKVRVDPYPTGSNPDPAVGVELDVAESITASRVNPTWNIASPSRLPPGRNLSVRLSTSPSCATADYLVSVHLSEL